MAPLQYLKFRNLLLLFLLALFATVFVCSSSSGIENQSQNQAFSRRKLMSETVKDQEEQGDLPKKKKSSGSSSSSKTSSLSSSSFGAKKNKTKLVKPGLGSSKNQSKLIKPVTGSSKNKTKLTKTTNSDHLGTEKTVISSVNLNKIKPKKMNSTSKPSNSTESTSTQIKKQSDLTKSTSGSSKSTKSNEKNTKKSQPQITKSPPNWIYQEDNDQDFISEIKDLPTKFHQSFIPDLHRFSTRSKLYLSKANKQITNGFKPYFGNKYSPFLATTITCTSIILPLLFLSLLFNRIKPYFSLQKLLIFIQIYLSIYFLILCLSSIITGLEPLRFLYATSPYTYVWVQGLQTLGYVLYLLLLLMYLVLVFSTECGLGLKLLGLAQTFVGFSVGLHYYITVFHRVVLRQPPKTNWKVHGVYTTCFTVICLLATAERRKKAYLEEGGEEGKKS